MKEMLFAVVSRISALDPRLVRFIIALSIAALPPILNYPGVPGDIGS